ncbi:MAG: AAA family ATPase, partial [Candidatus Heimdallarchaeota archaeon]
MYLEKLIILNYQSCQKVELELYKDEPTILIGINDSGKSIILKSIDLLFDGKTKFNFIKEDKVRSDISNT